jgi:hypothetical protein
MLPGEHAQASPDNASDSSQGDRGSKTSVSTLKPEPKMTLGQLVLFTFFSVAGGPFGIEQAVSGAHPWP